MKRGNLFHSLLGALGVGPGCRVYAKTSSIQTRRRLLLQESPLAGFRHHRAAAVWPFLREGETLCLRREPRNPHDPCAVAVWFKNEHLGYIPRRENRTLARLMDQGVRLETTLIRLLEEENPRRKILIRVEISSRNVPSVDAAVGPGPSPGGKPGPGDCPGILARSS